jgi:ATP-dependent DNA helicase RecQ
MDDLCRNLNLKRNELIDEIESIVHSGTKVNIDYYLNEIMDEYLLQDIYEYFKTAPTESLDDAFKEFKDDEVSVEDIQLVRIKFMSDMAN